MDMSQAVRAGMARLQFDALLGSRASRERDVVCAMVAPHILAPHTKLATTRWWQTTTFAEELFCDGSRRGHLYVLID